MKEIVLLMLICVTSIVTAETIQIGNGSVTNQSLPLEPFAVYSYSQQIYFNSEINTIGTITSIEFNYNIASSIFLANCNQIKIYLGQTPRTNLAGWIPSDSLSLVFDGDWQTSWFWGGLPGSGWVNIPLQTPFSYDGLSHLVVAFDENNPGYANTSDEFYCTTSGQNSAMVYYSNTVNPDPLNPPLTGYHYRSYRSNIRLFMNVVQITPFNPIPPNLSTDILTNTSLSWASDGQSFDIYFSRTTQPLQLIQANYNQTTYQFEQPLELLTAYHWQIVAHYMGNDYPSPVWTFTTAGENLTAPQNLTGSFIENHVHLEWLPPVSGSVVEYYIFRDNLLNDSTINQTFDDYAIQNGQSYTYYLRAVNYLNQVSPPSNTVQVTIPNPNNTFLYQGFETYEPFTESIAGWQNIDEDHSNTWIWSNIDFPGEGSQMAWRVFNPSQTIPPLQSVTAYTGEQFILCMNSLTPPNNDWLITPQLYLGSNPSVTFAARSYTADYGLERLRVLISSSSSAFSSFQPLSPEPWLSVPATWTLYQYDLSSYQNQAVYIAWQCVSWDAFALLLDEINIIGQGGYVFNGDYSYPIIEIKAYPNPVKDMLSVVLDKEIRLPLKIKLYNLRGQCVKICTINNSKTTLDLSDLSAGVYIIHSIDKSYPIKPIKLIKY